MKVDLVLITKIDSEKRSRLLQQTLESLVFNTNMKLVNRLVWVDDCSEMFHTIDDVSQEYFMQKMIGLDYVTMFKAKERLGVGGAKNKGVELHKELGRGDFLYMLDADVYFMNGWLDRLLGYHEEYGSEFKIIGGGIHPYLQPRAGEGYPDLTSHDAVSGWSWSLSYETWDKYGKLADNALGTGQSEDWEYCQRVRNAGFKVGCVQPQIVIHTGMTNTEGKDIGGRAESEIIAKRINSEVILL